MAGTISVAQALEDLFLQAVGTSTGTTDAFNSLNGAINSASTTPGILNAVSGAAGVTGVGASTIQMLQGFAASSPEAAAIVSKIVNGSAYASLIANLGLVGYQATSPDPNVQVQNNTLLTTLGSALGAAALKTPEGAAAATIGLSIAAAGFLLAGVATNDNSKFANTVSSIQNLINSYYSSLSTDLKATFSSGFVTNVQGMLGGGMLVPQIDQSGQINGYRVDIPTSVTLQPDGSALYTFSSGLTYQQGVKGGSGTLQNSSISSENIWTIPDPNSASSAMLGLLADGSYSFISKDSQNNNVAEVYIDGPGSYSIAGSSNVATFGSVQSSNSAVSVGANTFLKVVGSSDNISVNGVGGNITIGGNGRDATGAQDDHVNFASGVSGIVNTLDNSRVDVSGNGITLNAGNSVLFGLNGMGDTAYVAGANSTVFVGGNGQNATGAQDNHVNFANGVSGIVNANDNSRVDVSGNGLTLNAGNSVLFGLSGAGNTATVTGVNSSVWIGGNGQNATGAQDDHVNFANGVSGIVSAFDNSRIDVNGNSVTVNAGNSVLFGLSGMSNTATVTGGNSSVWIGGNGQNATGAQDDHVNFANGVSGIVNAFDNSRIDVNGNGITVNAGNSVLFGLSGMSNTATVTGGNSSVWIGGNGQNATGAQDDHVNFANGVSGIVNAFDNSRIDVNGNGVTVNAGNSVLFGLSGMSNTATVTGGNSSVWIGGNGQNATDAQDDHVNFVNGVSGTVSTVDNSRIDVSGHGITLNAGNNTTAGIAGDRNTVNVNGSGGSVWLNGSNDLVNMIAGSVVNVSSGTGDTLNGSNAIINITGNNQTIWASGQYDTITVTGVGVTVYAQNSIVNMVGAAANNNSNIIIGSGNTGTGWTLGDGYQALIGTPHAVGAPPPPSLPVFSDPSAGVPGSSSNGDGGVEVYPVPNPPDLNPVPIGGPPASDPIILSLDGQAVQTTALASSSTYFDMLNDGRMVQTAWGTANEGYLVYDPNDRNNTNVVTQDSQLVGGFDELQKLAQHADGTAHGTLTASDALWNSLKVWVDTTGTGQFQTGQLKSLDQLGITSLNLDGTQANRNNNGNQILTNSTFTRADGSTGDIAGVNLMYDPGATADKVDSQMRSLIAAMASYDVPAASSTLSTPVQQSPIVELAASLH
ncbi:hypothetical protein [Burkholderia sp. BCC1999]|uniref:beta strand repeat-containing protein n=1 Tax=Burkholderia sp. BCC1999 TaxID=2817448 RepID=UPI002AC35188|nr:hypothetical protein [Burkholderia sp. BCC1999]